MMYTISPRESVVLLITLQRPEKEDFKPSTYIDHTHYKTPGDHTSAKYVIKLHRFDSDNSEK